MPHRFAYKCCIPGCTSSVTETNHNHRFPHPKKYRNLFNIWIEKLNIESLREMDPDRVYQVKRICSVHFETKYISQLSGRLTRLSEKVVPVFNLPDGPSIENVFPLNTSKIVTQEESSRIIFEESSTTSINNQEVLQETISTQVLTFNPPETLIDSSLPENVSESAVIAGPPVQQEIPSTVTSLPLSTDSEVQIRQETKNPNQTITLKKLGVVRKSKLTINEKKLYGELKKRERMIALLKRKLSTNRNNRKYQYIYESLPDALRVLVDCNYRVYKSKSPTSHRYYNNEKSLFTSLYQRCHKSGYQYLNDLFPFLPTVQTLQRNEQQDVKHQQDNVE